LGIFNCNRHRHQFDLETTFGGRRESKLSELRVGNVETLDPISDDDDDYSKKNRPPACEEQKRCKYFLFIYI
uniref:hypothetical protein n=1 Tax=uncultured Prevotella sp. TaxID=159272 RepID=UPI00263002D0